MKTILIGTMLAMLLPVTLQAASLRYAEKEGDWLIMGMRNGSGSSIACGMKSDRETDHEFLYFVSVGPGPLKVSISVTTGFGTGPVSATLAVEKGPSLPLTGSVDAQGRAKLGVRDNQLRTIRDAMTGEKPLKLTLSRPGAPPQVIDISMTDASDGLDSLGACTRKMLGLDD